MQSFESFAFVAVVLALIVAFSPITFSQSTVVKIPTTQYTTYTTPTAAKAVVTFWQEAGSALWFAKDVNFDRRFRERFLSTYEAAARGELREWNRTPNGALALILLLDQFPRNAFRGTALMYATDGLARDIADAAIAAGFDQQLAADLKLFMYLPFGHSEDLADQERAVEYSQGLSKLDRAFAAHHRDIVRRFGRFPHRNEILGRNTTPEEQHYLENGGYRG